jgi:hypothetical protein
MQKEDVTRALMITATIGQTIAELGEVPSGELYAQVMGKLSLESYNAVIATLKRAKLVEERSHLLRWIGPPVRPSKPGAAPTEGSKG